MSNQAWITSLALLVGMLALIKPASAFPPNWPCTRATCDGPTYLSFPSTTNCTGEPVNFQHVTNGTKVLGECWQIESTAVRVHIDADTGYMVEDLYWNADACTEDREAWKQRVLHRPYHCIPTSTGSSMWVYNVNDTLPTGFPLAVYRDDLRTDVSLPEMGCTNINECNQQGLWTMRYTYPEVNNCTNAFYWSTWYNRSSDECISRRQGTYKKLQCSDASTSTQLIFSGDGCAELYEVRLERMSCETSNWSLHCLFTPQAYELPTVTLPPQHLPSAQPTGAATPEPSSPATFTASASILQISAALGVVFSLL